MYSGALTERFEVLEPTYEIDEWGNQHRTTKVVFAGYGRVTNVAGKDYWEAFAVSQETTLNVRARWSEALDKALKKGSTVRMRGREWECTTPCMNVELRNREAEFKLKEVS